MARNNVTPIGIASEFHSYTTVEITVELQINTYLYVL